MHEMWLIPKMVEKKKRKASFLDLKHAELFITRYGNVPVAQKHFCSRNLKQIEEKEEVWEGVGQRGREGGGWSS